MVAGGKNLYLYSSKQDVDWVILGIAGGILSYSMLSFI